VPVIAGTGSGTYTDAAGDLKGLGLAQALGLGGGDGA